MQTRPVSAVRAGEQCQLWYGRTFAKVRAGAHRRKFRMGANASAAGGAESSVHLSGLCSPPFGVSVQQTGLSTVQAGEFYVR